MVMESAPAAAFIVIQPDFVLEFLKIPLDAPADFDQPDQLRELCIVWCRALTCRGSIFKAATGPCRSNCSNAYSRATPMTARSSHGACATKSAPRSCAHPPAQSN